MVHVYNCHPFASQHIVQVGDYLVTIEEKNSGIYLRAYTNWRYQAEERSRVAVRLLGHLLRGASVRGGAQMEIIEIPLSERPVAVACCPVTGDLLVGCEKTLVLFTLRRQSPHHLVRGTWLEPVALCAGYIAVRAELEELLGVRARDCGLSVTIEKTGLEDGGQHTLSYVLYRRFAPDFFQGCSVEETKLHSLQLHPMFTSGLRGGVELLSAYQYPEKVLQAVLTDHLLHVITKSVAARVEDPYIDTTMRACPPTSLKVCALRMQLFIGLRSMCVLGPHVMLLSAADTETPEETERSSPRTFIVESRENSMLADILLAVGMDPSTPLESLLTRPFLSKKWAGSRPKALSVSGHGWNLYVVDTVSPITLYHEMVDYSCRYAETHPMGQSCRHLLSEAHLILCASLVQPLPPAKGDPRELSQVPTDGEEARGQTDGDADARTDRSVLEEAFRENCAQLGDCFSRGHQKDCHLALPYYRMSGLSITDVMSRNQPLPRSPHTYGPGFLFYLKHFLLEEVDQTLSQEAADEIIDIFSRTEPSQLANVCASPAMASVSAAKVLRRLQHLEQATGMSVPLTITMATMALRLDDLQRYTELMDKHAEMLLVYGFIEEPRLLLHGGSGAGDSQVRPTQLATQLRQSQPGLLAAAMVALHENNKVQLEQADQELGCEHSLLVDFWEAVLVASTQEAVIQELLFRLAVVYIDRLTQTSAAAAPSKLLKSTEDLPLLEQLSQESALWALSLHVLCATRRGQHGDCIEKLLDHCPQAIIPYANHHLQDAHMALWWQKLLPELCTRTRVEQDNRILLAALKDVLKVKSVDLMSQQAEQNRQEHHTDLFHGDELILRRGQTFMMWLDLSRPFDASKDKLHLELKTGAVPAVARGTHAIIPLVDDLEDDRWEAKIVKHQGDRALLSVNSAPTAVIGGYRLSVVTSDLKAEVISIHESARNIYILFNPWCEEDAVFMDQEAERQEYVLNDVGSIYYGTEQQIGVKTWNFGQFSEGMLTACLFVLEKSGAIVAGWGNPINSPDDGGVVEGNWSADYSGGTSPTAWSGSVEILSTYYEGGGRAPVRYGQCWVFSGVTTTVLRCLGIPTRCVTNFSSAHDTDVSLTTDVYFDENLDALDSLNADSIWNFHVWNDCWMTRPDLPAGMGGWQAVDATPQETSQGTFRCGPASLAALRSGQVYLPHDGPFVFAEVNSDKIYWQRNLDGTFTQIHNEKHTVGHHISTKAVGSDDRYDITHLYKQPEGSEEERITVETASRYGSKPEAYLAPTVEDVSVRVAMDGEGPRMGGDADLTITFTNASSEPRTVVLHSQVAVMYYTGVHKATVQRDRTEVDLLPAGVTDVEWTLSYEAYQDQLVDQAALMLTLSGRVSQTQQVLATQFSFRLRTPDLVIKPIGEAVVGKTMAAEMSFTNPLPHALRAVVLRVEGLGLLGIRKTAVGDIGSRASVSWMENFVPSLAGARKLLASLDCKELSQVNGVVNIVVKQA
ncbi:hypothetical protein NHX12_033685 [Muraenolepis orangiensis]|uniref:Protein-glutamine gamma-glutamyltransferase K n=1 Tax=Muraenolepis orangiensis TaxID=630683 RepID=A0A9Q0E461_9TELE|nr:hypothetical protein NHX12_033685 [Muraenolepis orangiensis]